MMKKLLINGAIFAALLTTSALNYAAEEIENCTPKILVKFKSATGGTTTPSRGIPGVAVRRINSGSTEKLEQIINRMLNSSKQLNLSTGEQITFVGVMPFAANYAVAEFKENLTCAKLKEVAGKIAEDSQVESTTVDRSPNLHQSTTLPNDSYYRANQWWSGSSTYGGVNLESVWLSPNARWMSDVPVNIAVIDSGISPHPDLNGVFLPGYDFVSKVSPLIDANNPGSPIKGASIDGDAEDSIANDMGSWWDSSSTNCTSTTTSNSNWHGTGVSSVIAGRGNNNIGLAGVNWGAKIVPVRVLGGCGSSTTLFDVVKGIYWAAGFEVEVRQGNSIISAKNINTVKIINASLGARGVSCTNDTPEVQLIKDTINSGAILVAAAGNFANSTDVFPANCSGVVSVAGSTQKNSNPSATASELTASKNTAVVELASGSSYNSYITVAAPYSKILVARNPGTKWAIPAISAAYPSDVANYALSSGTSFSAPIVSGIISLMLAKNSALSREQIIDKIKQTATPWAANANCSNSSSAQYQKCGAGVINAAEALAAISAAPTVVLSSASVNSGGTYTFNPTITDDKYAVLTKFTYLWQQTSGTNVRLSSTTVKTPNFQAPVVSSGSQVLGFRLTVTDDTGLTNIANVNITVNAAPNAGSSQSQQGSNNSGGNTGGTGSGTGSSSGTGNSGGNGSNGSSIAPGTINLTATLSPSTSFAADSNFEIPFAVTKASDLSDTRTTKIVLVAPKGSIALKAAAVNNFFCRLSANRDNINDNITCTRSLGFVGNSLSRTLVLNTPVGGVINMTMQVTSSSGVTSNIVRLSNAVAAAPINRPDVTASFSPRLSYTAGSSFSLNISANKGSSDINEISQTIISAPTETISLPLVTRVYNRCSVTTESNNDVITCTKIRAFGNEQSINYSLNLGFESSAAGVINYKVQFNNGEMTAVKTLNKPAGN